MKPIKINRIQKFRNLHDIFEPQHKLQFSHSLKTVEHIGHGKVTFELVRCAMSCQTCCSFLWPFPAQNFSASNVWGGTFLSTIHNNCCSLSIHSYQQKYFSKRTSNHKNMMIYEMLLRSLCDWTLSASE